jgi:ABC-type polysaccharide/polyol phosphate transport system ATPase subunit
MSKKAAAIEFRNVTKTFVLNQGRAVLLSQLGQWFSKPENEQKFTALKNVSFTLYRGESLGIVGRNGAGKSTLLSLASGVALPDAGQVTVHGRIAPLLELGSGFHGDLTGAENLRLNASLLGFSRQQVAEAYDRIVEYSGIGEFIHEPLKTYSNGMIVRLAFSIAINIDPDILVVDEVLAVGDAGFQEKCLNSMQALRKKGKTLLLVSHSTQMIRQFCDRAIWMDRGEVRKNGKTEEVLAAYEEHLRE